jgi:hypothetical protein
MADVTLRIGPAASGWDVACDLPLQPTYFASSARAELVARGMAMRFRDAGHDVKLIIADRGLQTVATHRYFAI